MDWQSNFNIQDALDSIVANAKDMTLSSYKKETLAAWRRAHPINDNTFQAFVRENIGSTKKEHFEKSHAEHMKLLGQQWKKRRLDTI